MMIQPQMSATNDETNETTELADAELAAVTGGGPVLDLPPDMPGDGNPFEGPFARPRR